MVEMENVGKRREEGKGVKRNLEIGEFQGENKMGGQGGGGAQPIEIWGNLLLINAVNAGSQRVFIVQ